MKLNFFRKKNITFLGRGGLIFSYASNDYFIDSEMSFADNVDIVIYRNSIKLKNMDISEVHKKQVLDSLINYLENEEHLKILIFDDPKNLE